MRRLLISLLALSTTSIMPAVARDAVNGNAARPKAGQHRDATLGGLRKTIEQGLRKRLSQAGLRNIELVPTSYLIAAKDAKGAPVLLMFDPGLARQPGSDPAGQPDGPDVPDDSAAQSKLIEANAANEMR